MLHPTWVVYVNNEQTLDITMSGHSHEGHYHDHTQDGHTHGDPAVDHGHSHEILDGPGSYLAREPPIIEGRDWSERAFTIGIGG